MLLCSDKKGEGLKVQLSPFEVQAWLREGGPCRGWVGVTLPQSIRPAPSLGPPISAQTWLKRQISVGGSLRARSPDPAQLSLLREPGTQDPTGPQAPQATQMVGARSPRLCSMQTSAAIRSQRKGWGRGSQGLGLASGWFWRGLWSPAGHTPSLFPGSPRSPAGPRPGELAGPREKAGICLLAHSPPDNLLTVGLIPSNGCSLTVARLGAGPLQRRPMAE